MAESRTVNHPEHLAIRRCAASRIFKPNRKSRRNALIERLRRNEGLITSTDHTYSESVGTEANVPALHLSGQDESTQLVEGQRSRKRALIEQLRRNNGLMTSNDLTCVGTPNVPQIHKLASEMREEREAGQTAHIDISEAVKKLLLVAAYTTGFDAEVTVCVSKDKRCQFFSYPPCEEIDKRTRETCLLKSSLAAQDMCDEFFPLVSGSSLFLPSQAEELAELDCKPLLDVPIDVELGPVDDVAKLTSNVTCKVEPAEPVFSAAGEVHQEVKEEKEHQVDSGKVEDGARKKDDPDFVPDEMDLENQVSSSYEDTDLESEEDEASAAGEYFKRLLYQTKFGTKTDRRRNGRLRKKERLFECYECNEVFRTSYGLKCHKRRHAGEIPYQCLFCGKGFANRKEVKDHQLSHVGEKRFQCSFCEKKFSTKMCLTNHQWTHAEEKPFKCTFCEKRFILKDWCDSHERLHTGERPYKCSFCERTFRSKHMTWKHEKIHSEEKRYKCTFCDKQFKRPDNVKVHERIHTGEKPFQCSFCEKRFTQKHAALSHERVHKDKRSKPQNGGRETSGKT